MNTPRERILLVENDPEVSDLIARQTLQPLGYQVQVVGAAGPAIQEAVQFSPDVILANLKLPGLSGKDLLVALSSQGLEVPIIVIAEKGFEGDVIQAFRLGAADYLSWPVREAEVVSAVERVLKQVRSRREREMLARQLKQTNQELQRRVRELTTLLAIGKAVTSITSQRTLLDKILEGAVYVTEADTGWILLREEKSKTFILSACHNLPKTIADKVNQPWEDGISSLVALSGESLSISGEPLKRFKVARLGESALVVPVKVKKEVVGLLVVVRKAATPFGASNQSLLEAVADYASISLVNAHLFKVLEERAKSLQQTADSSQVSEKIKDELFERVCQKLSEPLDRAISEMKALLSEKKGKLGSDQAGSVRNIQENIEQIESVVAAVAALQETDAPRQRSALDLNELGRQSITRFQGVSSQAGVSLFGEFNPAPVLIDATASQIAKALESLISNAIQYNRKGGQVTVRIERIKDGGSSWAHVTVKDNGLGMDKDRLAHLFDRNSSDTRTEGQQFGGLAISTYLVKEIITAHGGKIWVESEPGKGSTFHFTLLSAAQ
ncbi:MAG: response regulator [Chloroflexota bacterium]|nr:MAG: response regulator [Chloroflexota bacterium]